MLRLQRHAADHQPDLSQLALIRRDTYGIPHIHAKSEEAASFALGYAQSEDHCPQIIQLYLASRGEEAKYIGTGEGSDFLMKLYDNSEESARDLRCLPAPFRKLVEAYAAGVNRHIELHRADLPAWVQTITGADVLANRRAGAIRSVYSRATIRALERKYGVAPRPGEQNLPPEASAGIHLDAQDDGEPVETDREAGSNALALAGLKTVSGKPILLGNPHLNWNSLYWEAQVTVPGKYVWHRLHKVQELPRLLNPKGGYIQNCNNPPWYTSLRDPIDPRKFPSYLEEEREPALRPQIALEMIEGRERFSMEDVKT